MDEPFLNDIDDAELRGFADRFAAARPQLPREALDRARATLARAVTRRRPPRIARRAAALAVAASLLVAIGSGLIRFAGAPGQRAAAPVAEAPLPVVEDRFVVALPRAPDDGERRPLLPLAQYRTLIEALE